MDRRKTLINKLKAFKLRLNKELPIKKFIFFGSRAAGQFRKDSDIDIILVSNKFRNKKFRFRPLGFHNYWNLDYPVDFLCYTPEEFNKLRKQITIVREAVKEGIEI